MFRWIGRLFGERTAAEKQRQNPALDEAVQQSAEIYEQLPLRDVIDESRRNELARELFLEINRICNASNPVSACRERLAACMQTHAAYQVLVIPPAPEHDASGLRGQPGVSGELRQHLVEIYTKNDELRAAMFGRAQTEEFADLLPVLQRLFLESEWLLRTLNATRIALGDRPQGEDWYAAFLHATCARQEHAFRWELELPAAFAEDMAREASTAYAVFTDIVLSGASDPAREWREYYGSSGIPLPGSTGETR